MKSPHSRSVVPIQYSRTLLLAGILFLTLFRIEVAVGQEYVWAPNFPVGAKIADIEAENQAGEIKTFDDLKGENGLVLLFNRSFDWCPFCKRQLLQLTDVAAQFQAMGIGIATITYDPVSLLQEVAEDEEITFNLLHDEDIKHVNAFGILNTQYKPGDRAYGIPYPGIFLVDKDGVIRYKFAEEDYRVRPNFDDVLSAAANM